MSAITVRDVRYCAGRTPILHGVDMDVTPGSFTAVIGPNGSGKSTLVRCLAGLVRFSGHIEVDGHDVARTARKEMARSVAVVAQQPEAVEAHSVREVIALGRTPYLGALSGATAHDHHVVRDAATRTGVEHLLERTFSTCSGGERQRTHIARALAQECEVLLLDEPTNHLDVQQQFSILELVDAADITTLAVLRSFARGPAEKQRGVPHMTAGLGFQVVERTQRQYLAHGDVAELTPLFTERLQQGRGLPHSGGEHDGVAIVNHPHCVMGAHLLRGIGTRKRHRLSFESDRGRSHRS